MHGNKKLQLKKSGLRVLNAKETAQVAGGTGYEPSYDPGDCLHTDVCPSRITCTIGPSGSGGSGGTVQTGGHEKEMPVTYE